MTFNFQPRIPIFFLNLNRMGSLLATWIVPRPDKYDRLKMWVLGKRSNLSPGTYQQSGIRIGCWLMFFLRIAGFYNPRPAMRAAIDVVFYFVSNYWVAFLGVGSPKGGDSIWRFSRHGEAERS